MLIELTNSEKECLLTCLLKEKLYLQRETEKIKIMLEKAKDIKSIELIESVREKQATRRKAINELIAKINQ